MHSRTRPSAVLLIILVKKSQYVLFDYVHMLCLGACGTWYLFLTNEFLDIMNINRTLDPALPRHDLNTLSVKKKYL